MEELLWECLDNESIPEYVSWQDMEILQALYEERTRTLVQAMCNWLDLHGRDAEFCEDPEDPRGGVCLLFEDMLDLAHIILTQGKCAFDLACKTPFSRDVYDFFFRNAVGLPDADQPAARLYLQRDASSCLVLRRERFPQTRMWNEMVHSFVTEWLNRRRDLLEPTHKMSPTECCQLAKDFELLTSGRLSLVPVEWLDVSD